MTQKFANSADKSIYWIIGSFIVLAVIAIGFVAFRESQGLVKVATYGIDAVSKPKATVVSSLTDLGKMKVTDEKKAEFTLENTGDKPLQLFRITSSCGCTFGSVTINGVKGPEFSMHSNSNWTGELPPGQKAIVTVTYKPSIMPVKGEVTRAVYVSTNDPDNKELTFSVKAYVE